MSFLDSLQDRTVAVIGGGVTGAGVVRYLKARDVNPVVIDDQIRVVEGIRSLQEIPNNVDLAIVSPGWKFSHPFINQLKLSGVEIISEIDFAWRVRKEIAPDQKWIALTGTNGKTTTVQMVNSIFEAASISGVACGNVGDTVIEALAAKIPYDYLAIELSSFQIEWSDEAHFASSAVLNIAEDHIDWHGSFDAYANAKFKLLAQSDCAILNGDDVEVSLRSTQVSGKKVFYSLETPAPGELGLVENLLVDRAFVSDSTEAEAIAELSDIKPTVPHNVSNAFAAAGLALSIGISYEAIKRGLASFKVDHHRLELVGQSNKISWINDSKATNPHAAIASILSHEKVIWIAGGLAKGASMENLVKRAAPRLKAVILIGTDAPLIESALRIHAPAVPRYLVEESDSDGLMKSIVAKAAEVAEPGDVVLLAPACASMDQFSSYAHRGNLFSDCVRNHLQSESH